MELFTPERVFFEPEALNYPLGMQLFDKFRNTDTEVAIHPARSIAANIPGKTPKELYAGSKKTLVAAVRKTGKLETCRPSADYEFALYTNCPGSCEYCYLQTTQGARPYIRAYVNLEDIFDDIRGHAAKSKNPVTTFEAASSGDPLALEHITGSLAETIEFFGTQGNARLRLVTKYSTVEPLLRARHNGHTRFRFSINSKYVIKNFEHNTASYEERIGAAVRMAAAGYPVGFILAPIMIYDGWKEEYRELLGNLSHELGPVKAAEPVSFELIQHRFTPVAKKHILERFPNTRLDLEEEGRAIKYGKFGRFKYIYSKENATGMKEYLIGLIQRLFPDSIIEYFT